MPLVLMYFACACIDFLLFMCSGQVQGGAVLTNDDSLAFKLRHMRNFGFVGYDRVCVV